jgi:glycosyltransferase involved in cell wall biosynthesis
VTRRVDLPAGSGPAGRLKYGRVVRFAAVSERVRDILVDGGVPRARVDVIRDGVDSARLAGATPAARSGFRAEFGLEDDETAVGITAQFAPEKDHATLLRAWARVEAEAPGARLFLVGRGDGEAELRRLSAALGLSRVVFTGWRDDIPRVLAGLDAFVMTSTREGLGSSVMDAMACGLPVVATRAGGLPELVTDGEDGLLVPPGDPGALAPALLRIAREPGLARRLGAAARLRAESLFSVERMTAEYVAFYRRALGEEPT